MQVFNNPLLNPASLQSGQGSTSKNTREDQRKEDAERPPLQGTFIPAQELIRQGELRQVERVQSLAQSENLTLQGRQALNEYQNTEIAAQEYQGGTLVGIDIYV